MDSFVPRLQLNGPRTASSFRAAGYTSSSSGGGGGAAAGSWLNETAAPLNASGVAGPNYSSNNNTSMTNSTDGGYGAAGGRGGTGAAAPPSPTPRFGEGDGGDGGFFARGGHGAAASDYGPPRYTDPALTARGGFSASGSRSTPGPSTMRPLFASSPRDTYVMTGDTGRVPLSGSAAGGGGPRDDFLSRYRRFADAAEGEHGGHYASDSWRPAAANTFTSTYVGTSTGVLPSGRTEHGGVRVSDADWRSGGRAARSFTTGSRDDDTYGYSSGGWGRWNSDGAFASGLVDSRSRARADRWTDEAPALEATSLDGVTASRSSAASSSSSSSVSSYTSAADTSSSASREGRHSRRDRSRRNDRHGHSHGGRGKNEKKGHRRRSTSDSSDSGDNGSSGSEDSDDLWDADEADPLSFADAVVRAMDAQPVVPLALLRKAQEVPFVWARHPSHGIVLILLQHRGIYLPRYRELVDYHMAELFLHYLDLCQEGAFFVYYAPSKWPKERFFRIRLLPVNRLEARTEPVPHLVITLHESGVHILDAIPLDNLVGVTVTPQAACFRPFLESPNTIIGCREGRGHRARMPVDGAISLWFYDVHGHTSRSVDILTCDAKVYDIWTKTFRGLVSVNSSSVVQVPLTPQGDSAELAGLAHAAQEQNEIDHGERRGKLADDG